MTLLVDLTIQILIMKVTTMTIKYHMTLNTKLVVVAGSPRLWIRCTLA